MSGSIALVMACVAMLAACSPADMGDAATVAKAVSYSPPQCAPGQIAGSLVAPSDLEEHRLFESPVIEYPADTKQTVWGFNLDVMLRNDGSVVCYLVADEYGQKVQLHAARKALLAKIGTWRYRPFVDARGAQIPVRLREFVREERSPAVRRIMPAVPMSDVSITLERTGCYGACPSYWVTAHGDGRIVYEGRRFVDVIGRHEYMVDPILVENLLQKARQDDLWSMLDEYRASITDNPTYLVRLTLGEESKSIVDYVGRSVGMPRVVEAFEEEIDGATGARGFVSLSRMAVERLNEEGFAFRSKEGTSLLRRAVNNSSGEDQQAMLRLIELGVPLTGGALEGVPSLRSDSLLVEALENQRGLLLDALLEHDRSSSSALKGKDLDEAFRAAIVGGRLDAVRRIWDAGQGERPALSYDDQGEKLTKHVPVTLLLNKDYQDDDWQGLLVAQWLVIKGCDVKARAANGDTLLHIATDAGDIVFVRWLLDQGIDPSTPGEFDLPALGSAQDEDIALLLLQAGSDWKMDDDGVGILRYARDQHWNRMLAWVREHGGAKN